jgi:hypothetical protein
MAKQATMQALSQSSHCAYLEPICAAIMDAPAGSPADIVVARLKA